jgi:SAM-dependent methyltransferase
MPTNVPGIEGERRLHPRLWDYNFYMMKEIGKYVRRAIETRVPLGSQSCVVDLGCGTRPYEPVFQGRTARYIGVDLGSNPQADITIKPGETTPLVDASADVVLSIQVLEHVVDLDAYLSECRRLLRVGGLLLLSTHGFWTYHPYPTDVRRWTCWGLKHEIERFGFTVAAQDGCIGPLAYTSQLRLQLVRGFLYQFGPLGAPAAGLLSAATQLWMMFEDWITPSEVRFENSAVYVIQALRKF